MKRHCPKCRVTRYHYSNVPINGHGNNAKTMIREHRLLPIDSRTAYFLTPMCSYTYQLMFFVKEEKLDIREDRAD